MELALTGHGVEQFATGRLIGRRLLPADTDFLVELHRSEEVMAFHGGVRSRGTTESFVRSNVAHWRHYQFGLYVISLFDEPDQPIGRAGIRWNRTIENGPAADVSVLLMDHAWGQGIGTESIAALTAIGLDLDLTLTAGTEAGHAAARKVLEKVGLVYESEYDRHLKGWVRYRWPAERPSPATVSRRTTRRPS